MCESKIIYEMDEEEILGVGYEREEVYVVSKMKKKLSEAEKKERSRAINNTIASSTLDSEPPSKEALEIMEKYVNGEIELSEAIDKIIEKHNN